MKLFNGLMRARSVAGLVALLLLASPAAAAGKTEILWDTFGVPHIFAQDREGMFYAHGRAQMQNQANLLLRLYGESRGRAAEYWGPPWDFQKSTSRSISSNVT